MSLVPILHYDWPELRDKYKIEWPKYHLSYYNIDNYITWFSQDPSSMENIVIWSLDDSWKSDGTYLIVDDYQILMNTLKTDCTNKIIEMLKLLKLNKKFYYIYIQQNNCYEAVKKFIADIKNYSYFDEDAVLYHFPKELTLHLNNELPEGNQFKPLKFEHCKLINDNWKYKHPGSLEYLERNHINGNLTLGIFKNDDLVAYCMRFQYGVVGSLQVFERFRGKSLGFLLVREFMKRLGYCGFDSSAAINVKNIVSLNLFKKIGFKEVDKFHFISLNLNNDKELDKIAKI